MTAIISALSGAWPALIGILGLVGGVLWGIIKGKTADAKVAQAQATGAQLQAQVATANTMAAQAGVQAAANANQAAAGVAQVPDAQLDAAAAELGVLRSDK